jgi:hypothetical protein
MYLIHSSLTGTLPSSWSQLTGLTVLQLSDNNLSGTLPSRWSQLTGLTDLKLSGNNLVGSWPASWTFTPCANAFQGNDVESEDEASTICFNGGLLLGVPSLLELSCD